jgi:hypothetical protein
MPIAKEFSQGGVSILDTLRTRTDSFFDASGRKSSSSSSGFLQKEAICSNKF